MFGGFAVHKMHMQMLEAYPVLVRFLEVAEQQNKKRPNFRFLSNPKKVGFYKLQKLTDLSNAERSGVPIKATNI